MCACYNGAMRTHILNKNENSEELQAFCHSMIEGSYYPAYCREAVDMLHGYHDAASIDRDAAQGCMWCIRDGGRIVGTVTVANGELSRMFVLPELRGRGIGAALAREAIDHAGRMGLNKLTAWSVPFSRGFYERLGFVMLDADTLNFEGKRDIPIPYIEMALWPGKAQDVSIDEAQESDTEELLCAQRLAFEEQCRIYDDWRIPPMTEQAEDVVGFSRSGGVVLKAMAQGRIIGAVRGKVVEGVCHVGRLFVHPQWQGRSIARRLIAALEEQMQPCQTYSIYTGEHSEKNLALYKRQGYAPTGVRAKAKDLGSDGNYDLIWLEKPNPWPQIGQCARRFKSV
jgi:GNAT superfamily N-acetyltransferase